MEVLGTYPSIATPRQAEMVPAGSASRRASSAKTARLFSGVLVEWAP